MKRLRIAVDGSDQAVRVLRHMVLQAISPFVESCLLMRIGPAIGEIITNAWVHGNGRDPEKQIELCLRVQPDSLVVQVYDQGPGFDLCSVPDPVPGQDHGYGVFMTQQSVHSLKYYRSDGRFCAQLVINRKVENPE